MKRLADDWLSIDGQVLPRQGRDVKMVGRAVLRSAPQNRATLAQLVERLIRNQQVAGSTPAGGSIPKRQQGSIRAALLT